MYIQKHVQPNGTCLQDDTRALKKTKTGQERKRYLLCNFNRKDLLLQFDSGTWSSVRCCKVTHTGGEILQHTELGDILQERLREYMNDSDHEEQLNDDEEQPAAAGLGGDMPDIGDGCDSPMPVFDSPSPAADLMEDDIEDLNAEDWELLLCREDPDALPTVRPKPEHDPLVAASSASSHVVCHSGAWATPEAERMLVAPGSRLQRRVPNKCFQAHFKKPSGEAWSKVFKWSESGTPSMQDALASAVSWTWDQFEQNSS